MLITSIEYLVQAIELIGAVVSLAQLLGGIVAAAILDGLTPGPLAVSVTLAAGTSRTQGLFIEMFTTAALTMSVLMLAAGELPFPPD